MLFHDIKASMEALLYIVGEEGLTIEQLSEVLELEAVTVKEVLSELKLDLDKEGRGLQLKEIAGTYLFTTKVEHDLYIKRLAYHPTSQRLSQAALETLAIIAYKQPITRVEVEEIRGVKSDKAIHTLSVKQLIKEVGRAQGTGRAILYGTTKDFLDYFGLKDIRDLPPLPSIDSDASLDEDVDLFFKNFENSMEQHEN